jgi:hypothetical protein
MFFNRVYFITRQRYRRIREVSNSNRKMATVSNGRGGPQKNNIINAILVSVGLYIVNRRYR